MFRCSRRRGILWVPGMDGRQRRPTMAWRRKKEITDIIRKRRWSEAEARLVVSASQASGKSVLSFAREYGLQPSGIWRWSARLQEESTGGMRFHPVRRVEPEPLDPRPGTIEVVLLNGRRVRIPPGFVAEDLVRVLEVLEGGVSCCRYLPRSGSTWRRNRSTCGAVLTVG